MVKEDKFGFDNVEKQDVIVNDANVGRAGVQETEFKTEMIEVGSCVTLAPGKSASGLKEGSVYQVVKTPTKTTVVVQLTDDKNSDEVEKDQLKFLYNRQPKARAWPPANVTKQGNAGVVIANGVAILVLLGFLAFCASYIYIAVKQRENPPITISYDAKRDFKLPTFAICPTSTALSDAEIGNIGRVDKNGNFIAMKLDPETQQFYSEVNGQKDFYQVPTWEGGSFSAGDQGLLTYGPCSDEDKCKGCTKDGNDVAVTGSTDCLFNKDPTKGPPECRKTDGSTHCKVSRRARNLGSKRRHGPAPAPRHRRTETKSIMASTVRFGDNNAGGTFDGAALGYCRVGDSVCTIEKFQPLWKSDSYMDQLYDGELEESELQGPVLTGPCSDSDGCAGCTQDGQGSTVSGSADCQFEQWAGECRRKVGDDHCQTSGRRRQETPRRRRQEGSTPDDGYVAPDQTKVGWAFDYDLEHCIAFNKERITALESGESFRKGGKDLEVYIPYVGEPGGTAPAFDLFMFDADLDTVKTSVEPGYNYIQDKEYAWEYYSLRGKGKTEAKFMQRFLVTLSDGTENSFQLANIEFTPWNPNYGGENEGGSEIHLTIYQDDMGPQVLTEVDPVDALAMIGLFGGTFAIFWAVYSMTVGTYFPDGTVSESFVRCLGTPPMDLPAARGSV
jgi:hypothetical protein